MQVREAMHKSVEWMLPSASLVEIARKMKEHDIGSVPIGEDDKLVGMVTDRDIAIKGLTSKSAIKDLTARDVMTKGIVYCRDTEELGDALRIMEDKKIRRLPVIDKNKRMVGMLSLGDVSHAASHELTGELAASVSAHHAD
jgi:CBS domain-containing protein